MRNDLELARNRGRLVRLGVVGVLFVLLYWWSESLLHAYLGGSPDLVASLFFPQWEELLERSVVLILLLSLVAYAASMIVSQQRSIAMLHETCELHQDLAEAQLRNVREIETRLEQETRMRQETEKKLAAATEEWERTFDSVPDLIAVMDLDHRIIRMNKAMTERLADGGHFAAGPTCYACIHGTESPISGCPYGEMLSDGREHRVEVHEERLGGFFMISVTPIRDGDGDLCGAVHIARDITARKKMEDDLRQARDELEDRVEARTAELAAINARLEREVEVRIQAEQDLLESRRFLLSSLDALSAHVATLDKHGTILSVNKAWRDFADGNGLRLDAYGVGLNYLDVCDVATGDHSDEAAAVAHGIRQVMDHEKMEYMTEYPCPTPTENRWFSVRVTRFAGTGPLRVVVAHEDISERKRAELQLLHDAFHDPLTGLPNRALFLDRLAHAARHSRAAEQYLFAVLFLDIDDFKLVNDSFGHVVGDHLLDSISERLQASVRPMDTVARIGGDEFAILLDGLRDANEAAHIAGRVLRDFSDPFYVGTQEVFTSASIGIALSSAGFDHSHDLLRDADTALYRAKVLGKSRHAVFDREMHVRVVKRLQMETDLRHALARDEFEVYYQPLVSLSDLQLVGFEALARWNRPDEGMVMPSEFIPVAEESGLIVPIGLKVLREACFQVSRWVAERDASREFVISVNLSQKQLRQTELVESVREILKASGLPATRLKLEITESSIMEDAESAAAILQRLTDLGVRLSIDDFGTGYSSLSYLRRLPAHYLKIDRSFVGRLQREGEDYEVVKAIITLAHNLKKEVIAEGPERLDQVQILRSLGCEYGQGYFFAKPMPAAEAESLLMNGGGGWDRSIPKDPA